MSCRIAGWRVVGGIVASGMVVSGMVVSGIGCEWYSWGMRVTEDASDRKCE